MFGCGRELPFHIPMWEGKKGIGGKVNNALGVMIRRALLLYDHLGAWLEPIG